MKNYENINIILEDIEGLLDGILLSGLSVVGDGTLKEMDRLAALCDNVGLKEGAVLLFRLRENLNKKRHSLNFNIGEIVQNFTVLGTYVSVIKARIKGSVVEERYA